MEDLDWVFCGILSMGVPIWSTVVGECCEGGFG